LEVNNQQQNFVEFWSQKVTFLSNAVLKQRRKEGFVVFSTLRCCSCAAAMANGAVMAIAAMASHALQPLLQQQQQQSALARPWRGQVELCRLAAGRVIIRSQEPVENRSSQGGGGGGGGGVDGRYRRTNGAQKSRTSAQASVLGELRSDVVAEVEDLRLQEAGSATEEESSGASNCGLVEVIDGENDERDAERRAVDADAGSSLGDGAISAAALAKEVAKRRNFAIISHPDAGKTTLVIYSIAFVCLQLFCMAFFQAPNNPRNCSSQNYYSARSVWESCLQVQTPDLQYPIQIL
jgi:hypothetical protein